MRKITLLGPALAVLALSACVPRAEPPAPAPPPSPAPAPAPPAPPPAPPAPADWRDAPLSDSDWSHMAASGGSAAAFGPAGNPVFTMRCDAGRVRLARLGADGPSLTIRTTFGERTLAAVSDSAGVAATLAASDPLLDEIAFSRGRFLIQTERGAPLILPAWPEAARVIEDCRA